MIFDLNDPSLANLQALLADQHERLNFPELWHRTCIDVAINLLGRRLIDHPDCVEYCELADAGLDDAAEARTTWPRGWDIHLNYALTSPETGETWATCSGCSFIRPEMGLYPVGQFTRRDEGRIYLVDMFQREVFGVFVTPTAADIGGRPYEMVLAGRWDGQKVVPIEEPGTPPSRTAATPSRLLGRR